MFGVNIVKWRYQWVGLYHKEESLKTQVKLT